MNPKLTSDMIPVLTDNYIHVLHREDTGETTVIDPAEADPVLEFLAEKKWSLNQVVITHHHSDHIGGVPELKAATGCRVIGSFLDRHRLPPLDLEVKDGDVISFCGADFEVWHLPGHTSGHIAMVSRTENIVFSGDVLFGAGCGRVFEGTFEEMFASLQRFKTLDATTKIFCTHEYTLRNLEFAVTQMPTNVALNERTVRAKNLRMQGLPTVPLILAEECKTNPFLLAQSVEEFSQLRRARNVF